MSRYPSKVLLFGEYAIIHGSSALAVPYQGFYGEWKKGTTIHDTTDFADYLDDLEIEDMLFDYSLYQLDQNDGLHFTSNIPQGYGIGSSGALTTAFYERYFIKSKEFSLVELKEIFAEMESFFHGASSGFDPLISYLNHGLIINPEEKPTPFDSSKKKKYIFYLINSKKTRITSPLVQRYQEKYLDSTFQKTISELTSLNTLAIDAYMHNQDLLMDVFVKISELQSAHFKEMIIPEMRETYNKLNLKLCGAGGGGFYLGLTERTNIPALIKEHDIILIE